MSDDDDSHSDVPTRAVHESYLDMQRALKRYRKAKDSGDGAAIQRGHGDVQETVLTFYELLRPHLKSNNAVTDWWDGELPPYPGDGSAPDPEDGKGILQVQTKRDTRQLNGNLNADPSELERLDEWHDALELNGNIRLLGVRGVGDGVFLSFQTYQKGLRYLDEWETTYLTEEKDMGGFFEGKKTTETTRQRVDMPKLKRAARELSDVAEKLGALSEFAETTPRTEITEDMMEDIEEWRQANL